MDIIQATNLTKVYGNTKAVSGVSFAVQQGQIYGFLGPNGSGKTTTIGMMLGIINRSSGDIKLFETDNLDHARHRIGATLETPNFYPYLSGLDNLRIVAKIKNIADARIQTVLGIVKLDKRQKDKFKTYSLGMKQRLALASAMLSNPDLVVLDEPANGLDPEGIREIREIIKGLAAEGKTIFLSSHLLNEVEQTCTHVAVIKKGELVSQGSIREIVSRNLVVMLRAKDVATLQENVARYEHTVAATLDRDTVVAELKNDDLASLNMFLSQKGIYLSHLSQRQQSLEEAFMELTQDAAQIKTPANANMAAAPVVTAGDLNTSEASNKAANK
ncbi:MAG: ABC transporter ATP-binding protein [Rhizobacter sp.]|nr:ABC transporter ATP-binding protein [Chlorobiales bacterium]